MSFSRIVEAVPGGRGLLASARLRRQALMLLEECLEESGLSQADLARVLGRSRSAVNQVLGGDGNVRLETLAEYLDAMGCEVELAVRARSAASRGGLQTRSTTSRERA
jgi:transcriptional regulator with XRE-family HTH domain